MKVSVRLFAAARQFAGAESLELELPAGSTLGDLRAVLADQVPTLAPLINHLLFAMGSDYVADERAIDPNQPIACIPPVSGG